MGFTGQCGWLWGSLLRIKFLSEDGVAVTLGLSESRGAQKQECHLALGNCGLEGGGSGCAWDNGTQSAQELLPICSAGSPEIGEVSGGTENPGTEQGGGEIPVLFG